jgi:hypothetical protein
VRVCGCVGGGRGLSWYQIVDVHWSKILDVTNFENFGLLAPTQSLQCSAAKENSDAPPGCAYG